MKHLPLLPLALVALGACIQESPPLSYAHVSEGTYPVGAEVEVLADWTAGCKSWFALIKVPGGRDRHETYSCHDKPFRIVVSCQPACGMPDGASMGDQDVVRLRVVPLTPGPLVVKTVSTRLDTGEVSERSFPLNIVAPGK